MKRTDLDKLSPWARRLVVEQLREPGEGNPIPKRPKGKYRNEKSEGWDSKLERRYYQHLQVLEQAGAISNLRRQVTVRLGVGKRYMRIDFVYLDNRLGELVYDDAKGMVMTDWKVKADIWAAGFGPGLLRITKRKGGEWVHEDIRPATTEDALRLLIDNARATMGKGRLKAILEGEQT